MSDVSNSECNQWETVVTSICDYMLGNKRATNALPQRDEQFEEQFEKTCWPRGTGYGTDYDQWGWRPQMEPWWAKQRDEEDYVIGLLDKLTNIIRPVSGFTAESHAVSSEHLPQGLCKKLRTSHLIPSIASRLRNDSVLDMSRHIRLYSSILRALKAVATNEELCDLLQEPIALQRSDNLTSLLDSMSECLAKYHSRLKATGISASNMVDELEQDHSLSELTEQVIDTSKLILKIEPGFKSQTEPLTSLSSEPQIDRAGLYEKTMKDLQFGMYNMLDISATPTHSVFHHHCNQQIEDTQKFCNSARSRRLAQEIETLRTSLPLSASSSVFVRFDEKRMDVMKALIMGPADTPYMNGCFEFNICCESDYPSSPPLFNLQTTGNHKVRFNPNLYTDGKVCLSILNTWGGRPEECWNEKTSSILQVLVSIQSMVFVSDPYFNEPDYEPQGPLDETNNSREYNSNIRQATVKFAMLEMLKNPSACFKDVIRKHFWMKREEIKAQIQLWMDEANTPIHYQELMNELQQMQPPEGFVKQPVDLEVPDKVSVPINMSKDLEVPDKVSVPIKVSEDASRSSNFRDAQFHCPELLVRDVDSPVSKKSKCASSYYGEK